jgi:hypothetical protein
MAVETRFKVEFEDCVSDSFEDDTPEEEMQVLIEEHIRDYCREHGIEREHLTILDTIEF